MVRKSVTGLFVVTLALAAPGGARGQEPQANASRGAGPRSTTNILLMQNALEVAVQTGASDLLMQMSRVTRVPPSAQLNGRPQAHGFELPGWGMFFYVRVPGMSATVRNAWPYLVQPRAFPVGVPGEAPVPPVSPVDASPAIQAADADVLKNPDAHYVQSVRLAIVEAMLEDSRALRLQSADRLTIAAREEGGLNPLDPSERLRTMYFEVTGADLAAYHRDEISLEEARTRVIVRTAD